MKMLKIRFITAIVVSLLVCPVIYAYSSGKCGNNVTWILDDSGTLLLFGSGDMNNYSPYSGVNVPWNSSLVKSIKIDDGITSIGDYSFWLCNNLSSVKIGNSVSRIGFKAFSLCSNLMSVEIPNSVTIIDDSAFNECPLLSDVKMSESLTSIGSYSFSNCKSLTKIVIPNSVVKIGKSAFANCNNLINLTIGSGTTQIGDEAFYCCSSINKITSLAKEPPLCYSGDGISSKVFWIVNKESCIVEVPKESIEKYNSALGWSDFQNIRSLPETTGKCGDNIVWYLDENGNLTLMGSGDMYDYSSLEGDKSPWSPSYIKSVSIDNRITSIGSWAFRGCDNLTSISIGDGVKTIGDAAFYECTALDNVDIPNSVTVIGQWSFYSCSKLSSLKLGKNVNDIKSNAFSDCIGLTEIVLPESLNSIGNGAFMCCMNMNKITSLAVEPPACYSEDGFYSNVFERIDKELCIIEVPEESISKYHYALGWNAFFHIKSAGVDIASPDKNITISAENKKISVDGANDNSILEVYNTTGKLLFRSRTKTFDVYSEGVYVIRVDGCCFKVLVK